jgi:hypothetical protein
MLRRGEDGGSLYWPAAADYLDGGRAYSLTLHFGPDLPTHERRPRWPQTVPGRGWFANLRIYGPQAAACNGSWKPGDIVPD